MRHALETDGELGASELTLELAQAIARQVWGQGFPQPLFEGVFAVADQRRVADKHAKLVVSVAGRPVEAIVFNDPGPLPARIHAAYRAEVNRYQDLLSLQLVVEHWQPA